MTEDRNTEDTRFTEALLASLESTPVPAALEARILADFDRVAARRAPGAMSRVFRRWRDAIWPGAPVWKPASLLALSLAIGLMAGVFVPASAISGGTNSSSDQQIATGDAPPVVNMTGDL